MLDRVPAKIRSAFRARWIRCRDYSQRSISDATKRSEVDPAYAYYSSDVESRVIRGIGADRILQTQVSDRREDKSKVPETRGSGGNCGAVFVPT